ncbi:MULTISPECIES: sensor histidine kinase [Robinsoniella]|uniref:sensor histidine kinase n=1 Tax=Robinsoniella TaxID=588605 RepID=UPI00048556B8|nr:MULTISPECIES: sensor histidine kinase [Robinsoniella]
MRRLALVKRIGDIWRSMTIKKKIGSFSTMVFIIISLAVIFNIWTVKFSLVDFSRILKENAMSSALVDALEEETLLFEDYIKNPNEEKRAELDTACERTRIMIANLPFEYFPGEEYRYSKTWSIRNSYPVYAGKREEILSKHGNSADYISDLYKVYEMQGYQQDYARTLMRYTMETGNASYQNKIPVLQKILITAVVFAIVLFLSICKLTNVLNKTIISPIIKLVEVSKKIAENDYTVADVEVESQDELGELVHAFNKMKYATGEYIQALEEKRKTMDLLHTREMERVDLERRLEAIRLDMLKNQINPHFLFNTLNVISGMAKLEDAETTEKMIKALSTLFRYNLKTMEAEVSLTKELCVIREYIYLQKIRFGNRIKYEIVCQVDRDEVMIPSFTLQPLVENAIIHGVSKKEEGGKITINIEECDQILCITVADTGSGIKPDILAGLRQQMEQEGGNLIGIGLGNAYKRIRGMYENSEFEIASKPDVGTVITIRIPQL